MKDSVRPGPQESATRNQCPSSNTSKRSDDPKWIEVISYNLYLKSSADIDSAKATFHTGGHVVHATRHRVAILFLLLE